MAKFSDVLTIINGRNQKQVENPNGKYPIYGSGGVMGYADDYICDGETVVIGRKGTINKPIYVDRPFWNVDTAFGLSAKKDILLPKYLYYFCESFDFEQLNTTVTIPSLTKANLLNIEIQLPTLDEQRHIVEVLDKINELMFLRNQQIAKLDELVKARFWEMFGDPLKNNKEWTMRSFQEICTVRQGLQIPISKRLTQFEKNCYEYITVAYLHGSKEREYIKNPKSTVICTKDDILMTRTGNTGMVVTDVSGVFHNNFFLIDFDRTRYKKNFLTQYLNLEMIQSEIRQRAGTSTIPDLNHGEFYKIPIYEPPIELQEQFSSFVEQTNKFTLTIRQSLDKLEVLKKSLMQEYFG